MDSTSIITQVNKDDESAEVSPYTQNKREYAFTTSILLTLLRYKYAVTGANFASQGVVSVVSLTSHIENSPKLSLFELSSSCDKSLSLWSIKSVKIVTLAFDFIN